jgi:hypothetical protein
MCICASLYVHEVDKLSQFDVGRTDGATLRNWIKIKGKTRNFWYMYILYWRGAKVFCNVHSEYVHVSRYSTEILYTKGGLRPCSKYI